MEILCCLMFGWILQWTTAYNGDESISFSPVSDERTESLSYWFGNITLPKQKSLIEDGINIELYLNKFQGLLFYSIDSKYRTFWVEYSKELLIINYYNFKIDDIDKRIYQMEKLCNQILSNNVSLRFSTKGENIEVACIDHIEKFYYLQPSYPISTTKFKIFFDNMVLPIPFFNNVSESDNNLIHIWIGNTPSLNNNEFRNTAELKSNPNNLWGCVKLFQVGNSALKLSTFGEHYGEMFANFCQPVCHQNPCFNNVRCSEMWRGRFSCDCGLSQYVGNLCNESYSIKFNGSTSIRLDHYFSLKILKFSFQPVIYGESLGLKLLSLKFPFNESLNVYISQKGFLGVRYLNKSRFSIDSNFERKVIDGLNYTLSIRAALDKLTFELQESRNKYGSENTYIMINQNNLIVNEILIGESHVPTMSWINKFHGCISNFMWQSGKRSFLWSQMDDFDDYPKCGERMLTTTTEPLPNYLNEGNGSISKDKDKVIITKVWEKNPEVNNSLITYTSIFVGVLIFGIILFILVFYLCVKKKKSKSFNSEKEKLTNMDNNSIVYVVPLGAKISTQNMTFKPAYKARSMSTSTNGRSIVSLPMSPSPTLVTPENGELL